MSTSLAKGRDSGPCIGARQIKIYQRLAILFVMIIMIMVMVMVCSLPCIGARQIKMAGNLVNHNDDGDDLQWTLHRSPPNKDAQTANKHNGENHLLYAVHSPNLGDEDDNVFNFAFSFLNTKFCFGQLDMMIGKTQGCRDIYLHRRCSGTRNSLREMIPSHPTISSEAQKAIDPSFALKLVLPPSLIVFLLFCHHFGVN